MKGLVEPGTGINCKVCVYGSTCNTGRGHAYHVKSCVQYTEGKPQTNADRIRAMSDEDLAEWVNGIMFNGTNRYGEIRKRLISNEFLEWLKEEVSE